MESDASEVGRRIKEIRTDLGYSMSQFGELISNSPKTTTNELLYGSPEEFITKIVVDRFRSQLNQLFIQQINFF